EVVAQLLVRHDDPIDRLTPRELHVLRLMAEGRSNGGIVEELKGSPSAGGKYVTNIFLKLDPPPAASGHPPVPPALHDPLTSALPPAASDHRRVLAVLKYLGT